MHPEGRGDCVEGTGSARASSSAADLRVPSRPLWGGGIGRGWHRCALQRLGQWMAEAALGAGAMARFQPLPPCRMGHISHGHALLIAGPLSGQSVGKHQGPHRPSCCSWCLHAFKRPLKESFSLLLRASFKETSVPCQRQRNCMFQNRLFCFWEIVSNHTQKEKAPAKHMFSTLFMGMWPHFSVWGIWVLLSSSMCTAHSAS